MKKLTKIFLALALSLTMVFGLVACNNDDVLVVYTEAGFAPFEYTQGTEIVGADIDIAKHIAKELGKELVVKSIAFDTISTTVSKDENALGIAGYTIRTGTEKPDGITFSDAYYTSTQYILVNTKHFDISGDTAKIDALEGKKVGAQLSTTGHTLLTDSITAGDLTSATTITPNTSYSILAGMLDAKSLDAVVLDELPAKALAAQYDDFKVVEITDADLEEYGVVVNSKNTQLLAAVNKVLDELMNGDPFENKIDTLVQYHTINAALYGE